MACTLVNNDSLKRIYRPTVCMSSVTFVQGDTKKTGTFVKPNKNWRNPRKKFIDRNWTITTWLL